MFCVIAVPNTVAVLDQLGGRSLPTTEAYMISMVGVGGWDRQALEIALERVTSAIKAPRHLYVVPIVAAEHAARAARWQPWYFIATPSKDNEGEISYATGFDCIGYRYEMVDGYVRLSVDASHEPDSRVIEVVTNAHKTVQKINSTASAPKMFDVLNPNGPTLDTVDLDAFGMGAFQVDTPSQAVVDKLRETGFEFTSDGQAAVQACDEEKSAWFDDDEAERLAINAGFCCVYLPDYMEGEGHDAERLPDGSIPYRLYACRKIATATAT